MLSTKRIDQGVTIIELATAELDPTNLMRKPDEPQHLVALLQEIWKAPSMTPVILDLRRLRHLTSWEQSDIVMVVGRVVVDWKFEKLVVVTPQWRNELQRQYMSIVFFPELSEEAIAAAFAALKAREARFKQAG